MAHAIFTLKSGTTIAFDGAENPDLDFIANPELLTESDNPANNTRRRNKFLESVRDALAGGYTVTNITNDPNGEGSAPHRREATSVIDGSFLGYDTEGIFQIIQGVEIASVALYDPASE